MKKIFIIVITLYSSVIVLAQQDTNMPGLKMDKSKSKDLKKSKVKSRQNERIQKVIPQKNDDIQMQKDTLQSEKGKIPMDIHMDMSKQKEPGKEDSTLIQDKNADKVNLSPGKTVRYDLYVTDTMVNFTGKAKHAIAVNGCIPMPTLTFTEGDTAEIYLHNMLKTETSLHWHGVFLPNQFDGVPYLTTAPIPPGTVHLYRFAIVQNGTYWYHSHTKLQEQSGMYGALVFKKRDAEPMKEYTLVLSDWTNEKPHEVQRRLHAANDWYAIEKGSGQSYAEAISKGYFKTKVINEWKRMKAMDVSDVYYERFLANGNPEITAPQFKAGEKVRLRIVNGSSSTYFWLQYAGGKLTVTGNDGNDVEPVMVDRMIVGIAETYDIIVTIPENMSYEFRATAEDRTKATSLWFGSGMKMKAPVLPHLKYFEGMKMMNNMMKMNGDMKLMKGMEMSNQAMDMNTVMYPEITGTGESLDNKMDMKDSTRGVTVDDMKGMDMANSNPDIVTLNYTMLRSPLKTTLPDVPFKELHFTLTGNMNRYLWSINNKTINESDNILIRRGENLRIILFNNSMMRHPMHLHGHDFRLLNGQGEYAPLKNVVDIMPMETDTLEFAATESGDWFFHCHVLYHMMAGMGKVFSYENSPVNPELPDTKKANRDFKRDNHMLHFMAKAALENNGTDGEIMLEGNKYNLQQMWHLGYHDEHGYESETNFGRYTGKMQWLFPYIGFDYHYKKEGMHHKNIFGDDKYNLLGQLSNKNNRKTFVAGVQYTLPMLLVADGRIDGNGKVRFQLSREDVPVTSRIRFDFMVNTDKEYTIGFSYIMRKWFAMATHYDSDMGLGIGVTLIY
ncbi:MAG: multicopper oxidase domain-containing protein [Ginsengibacter sp.]